MPDGSYWVPGDNWGGSTDSRDFGFVPASSVEAKLWFRILPLSKFGAVTHDVRLTPLR